MPASKTRTSSKFSCSEANCKLSFTSQSNLNRHKKSKHGDSVLMPCGKSLPNHTSNVQRHQKSCHGCNAVAGQSSVSGTKDNFQTPSSADSNASPVPDTSLEDNDLLTLMLQEGFDDVRFWDVDSINSFQFESSL
ncbi:hypothetical protein CSAL01_03536 [Colletotrichum salicis]|uniref:C2H2-type domain-containing protein n=1 Tax=Colletotrichum salicis TaxID=1209931 RepID=A0A135SUC3_9PEZI|nr:hypothetical protein CSAL01_03536 [Colletotrichum salicis]